MASTAGRATAGNPDAEITRVELLGIPIHATTLDMAARTIVGWTATAGTHTAHFCNVHLLVTAHDDWAVRRALTAGSMVAMDGLPLVWLARLLGHSAERVAGPDLMAAVMDRGRSVGVTHFLYGATPHVLTELRRKLEVRYPGLLIVGTIAPPLGNQDSVQLEADLDRIRRADPDFVWVGLGAPKQDLWVEQVRDRVKVAGLLAVGAAFDFHAGTRRRAPRWMQRTGTEWLFRLLNEPRRLWRRYAVTNSRFVLLAARQLLSGRRRGRR